MRILFRPKTDSIDDLLTASAARRIWNEQKGSVVSALEQTSGLAFMQKTIRADTGTIEEMHSGWPREKAMSLPMKYHDKHGRLTFMDELEYVTLVTHELAHHLLLEHSIRAAEGVDHNLHAHQHIYLFLLDAWDRAYGAERRDQLIKKELAYARGHFIPRSLRWADALGGERRRELMALLVKTKQLPDDVLLHGKLTKPGASRVSANGIS